MTPATAWQQWIIAPALCIAFLVASLGWGTLALRSTLGARRDDSWLHAAVAVVTGTAVLSWLLGWLGYFQAFTPARGFILLALGVSLAVPVLRELTGGRPAPPRDGIDWWTIAWIAAALLYLLYLPPKLNPDDDTIGYGVFPLKIRWLGGTGYEPFSERRAFGLGAQYPVQAMILSVLPFRWISLPDPLLAMCVVLACLAAIAPRDDARSLRLTVFAAVLCANTNNHNLAPKFLLVPPTLVMMLAAVTPRVERLHRSMASYALTLGILAGFAVSLRPTALLVAPVLVLLALLHATRDRAGRMRQLATGTAIAAASALAFALPFSLDLARSSGTYFYPLLGKGFAGSPRTLFPDISGTLTAAAHLRNLVVVPMTDVVLLSTAAALLLWHRWASVPSQSKRDACVVFGALFVAYVLTIYATGGTGTHRYMSPSYLALGAVLVGTWKTADGRVLGRSPRFVAKVAAALCLAGLVASLPGSTVAPYTLTRGVDRYASRLRTVTPDDAEVRAYTALQNAMPAGASVLASLTRNNLLDVRRNLVFVNDQAMMAGPPGWSSSAPTPLADYLRRNGVDYVAVMRDTTIHAPPPGQPIIGWLDIQYRAMVAFRSELERAPFASAIVFESDSLRLYRVPK